MKKVLFTLIGVLGICLGLTINMNDTVHAANPVVVDYAVSATYTGWVSNSDGTYSYYIDGAMICSEVIEIGTKYYAFTYDGIMYADQEFYLDGTGYRAKADGTLLQNEWHLDYDGTYYYYGDDCKAPNEEIRIIRGNKYYFRHDGSLLVNAGVNYFDQTDWKCIPYAADANGYLTEIPNNKWTQVGSYWYYVQDGNYFCGCNMTIDGTKYVFDYDYRLLENDATVFIYDSTVGVEKNGYYRAKAGGELYRNQWYQDKAGYWYYYDNDGRATEGLTTISGKTYYFDNDGRLVVNDFVTVNDKLYACFSDGTMLEVSGTRWIQLGSDWYYVKNNSVVYDEVMQISGKYYYFDYYGRMVTDREIHTYNQYASKSGYVRAKANGTLYHNEWYQDEDKDWYYYGNDCIAPNGLLTIGGKKYYFSLNGWMCTNTWITTSEAVYYAQENGEVVVFKNNAWTSIGEDWYYVKDGEVLRSEVAFIGGNYYGFDYDGKMYKDESFYAWDELSDKTGYYRAKPDGTLYRNQWYQDENEYWYYYGNDATRVSGLQTIGGNLYYFGDSMYTSGSVYADGTNYVIQKNGVAIPLKNNAWTTVEGEWYYVKDGELPCNEILLIGGNYYAFDYDGTMYSDEQGCVYGEDYSGYCRANADGTLLRNQWYQNKYDSWYYYGDDCIALEGINIVSGKKYFFDYDGWMKTSGYAYGEDGDYLIGEDGVLIETPGWNLFKGQWYYMNSDGTLYYGLLSKGNTLYYMGYYMYKNSDMFTVDGVLYQAKDSTGVLTKITTNGWHRDRWNSYYVSNGKVVTGWKQIDGKWYYFYYDGSMAYDNWLIINEARYAFDQNGVMYSNTWLPDGQRYATSSGALATGVYTINGKKYYFDSEGYLDSTIYINNGKYIINGKEYTFKNGWNQVGSDWYYVAGDELASGLWEIGGKYYYFDYSTYAMVSNEIHNSRYFGEDGAAIGKGWFQVTGYWYYADKDSGYLASGLTKINDKEYYFSNYIMQTTDIISGSTIYRIASDGVVKSTEKVKNDWYYVDCEAYYYKDGIRYTGWLGESYIKEGIKVFGSIVYDYKNDAYYYIGSDGNCVYNAWINIEDTYYYAGSDGKLKYDEWLYYSGSWYYFSSYCMYTGVLEEDGKTYYFGKDGKLKKTFSTISDGWHSVDGEWLFASDGRFLNDSKYISGKYYYFIDEAMIKSDVVHYAKGTHIYDSQGKLVQKQGWYSVDGEWYYINVNGASIHGWLELGNKKYYLDPWMITGYKVIDNKLYYFDDQGVCKGTYGVANGWYSAGGNWYYFENEQVVDGETRIIGGKMYAFNYEGIMVTNDVYFSYIDYEYHYFGSDGVMITKSGVYTTADGDKVYVSSNGIAYTGTVYINGKIQSMQYYK